MRFTLPEEVDFIIDSLNAAGYRADIVGGSVRDLLLGKNPDDYDITTSATPEQIKAVFCDRRTVDTGIKHGTVSLVLGGRTYEITTYRVDGEYLDSRHPASVSFTRNIADDLSRRDFTVNAMAYNHIDGLTDLFGGISDLHSGIIRAVGDPDVRFGEDALRILRALRFASVLGFKIEQNTSDAVIRKSALLTNVSSERIWAELKKTFSGKNAYRIIYDYSEVFTRVIPPLAVIRLPDAKRFDEGGLEERFLSLFALSADDPSATFDIACGYLRTENNIRKFGARVLSSLGKYDLKSRIGLTRMLRDHGIYWSAVLVRLEILLGADKEIIFSYTGLVNSSPCYDISGLAVKGDDILALGISGRTVGQTLERLLSAVIDGELPNRRDRLLAFALELKDKLK